MSLSPWSPFRGLGKQMRRRRGYGEANPMAQMQDEMNRMIQNFMGTPQPWGWSMPSMFDENFRGFSDLAQGQFVPRVDVCATDDAVQVSAELPGMTADDIEINCESDRLRIRGEKSSEKTRNEDGMYHTERSFGSFERIVALPHPVNVDKAEAKFKDGVLTVEIPRVEPGTSSRKLKIKSN